MVEFSLSLFLSLCLKIHIFSCLFLSVSNTICCYTFVFVSVSSIITNGFKALALCFWVHFVTPLHDCVLFRLKRPLLRIKMRLSFSLATVSFVFLLPSTRADVPSRCRNVLRLQLWLSPRLHSPSSRTLAPGFCFDFQIPVYLPSSMLITERRKTLASCTLSKCAAGSKCRLTVRLPFA